MCNYNSNNESLLRNTNHNIPSYNSITKYDSITLL